MSEIEKQRLLVASIFYSENHVISKKYYPQKNGVSVMRIATGYREASLKCIFNPQNVKILTKIRKHNFNDMLSDILYIRSE